jgi:hypothetical protein
MANQLSRKEATMKRKEFLALLIEHDVQFDKLVVHQDGTASIQQSYFYRMGLTVEKMENRIKQIPGAEIVDSGDVRRDWPSLSYMYVTFRIV